MSGCKVFMVLEASLPLPGLNTQHWYPPKLNSTGDVGSFCSCRKLVFSGQEPHAELLPCEGGDVGLVSGWWEVFLGKESANWDINLDNNVTIDENSGTAPNGGVVREKQAWVET